MLKALDGLAAAVGTALKVVGVAAPWLSEYYTLLPLGPYVEPVGFQVWAKAGSVFVVLLIFALNLDTIGQPIGRGRKALMGALALVLAICGSLTANSYMQILVDHRGDPAALVSLSKTLRMLYIATFASVSGALAVIGLVFLSWGVNEFRSSTPHG